MKKQNKTTLPKGFKGFKFKIYWIYIIIFIFFLGLNFIGNEMAKPTNWQEFNQEMLQTQKVEKIVIINKEKAYIYILKNNSYQKKNSKMLVKKHLEIHQITDHIFILKLDLLKHFLMI